MSRYVVSLGDGDYLREGRPYVFQGEWYCPLGNLREAKVYDSKKKAERACFNRGVASHKALVREIDEKGNLVKEN